MKKRNHKHKHSVTFYIYWCLALFLFSLFLFFGPPDIYTKTSSPEFCGSCHVMETQYDSWSKAGLHRTIKCVDCHLPNNNIVNHMVWKGYDGMKDVIFFYSGIYGQNMKISSHGKNTVKKNCMRCHKDMISQMKTNGRFCWDCHRRIKHRFPGKTGGY